MEHGAKRPYWFLEEEIRHETTKHPRLDCNPEDLTLPSFDFSQWDAFTPQGTSVAPDTFVDDGLFSWGNEQESALGTELGSNVFSPSPIPIGDEPQIDSLPDENVCFGMVRNSNSSNPCRS